MFRCRRDNLGDETGIVFKQIGIILRLFWDSVVLFLLLAPAPPGSRTWTTLFRPPPSPRLPLESLQISLWIFFRLPLDFLSNFSLRQTFLCIPLQIPTRIPFTIHLQTPLQIFLSISFLQDVHTHSPLDFLFDSLSISLYSSLDFPLDIPSSFSLNVPQEFPLDLPAGLPLDLPLDCPLNINLIPF